jgi:putative ABC transport system permease protein
MKPLPPSFLLQFFQWYCHPKLRDHIEGDLIEIYQERVIQIGKRKADLKFGIDVILLFRKGIIKPAEGHQTLNNYGMYKSYFKIGWRNLLRDKAFSFINIFGLAIGMTACVLIMLYVADEMSYDKHHSDGDRVFRVASEAKGERYVAAAGPIAEGLKKDLPEVEQSARLLRFPGIDNMLLRDEDTQKQFFEINGFYVDSTFFNIFSYDLTYGDIHTALNGPNSIVISDNIAAKFFGDKNPIDHVLTVTLPFGAFSYTVKGVFKTKSKSHIPANFFLSMNNGDVGGWVKNQTNWATNNIFHTYVKLKQGSDPKQFEAKLTDFLQRNAGKDLEVAGLTKTLFIQPLEDIYLHSNYGFEVAPNGNITYIYILTSIAAFLLVIACINFMNLATARSERRAKEVGLRKVIGAVKGALVNQFLMESLMMSALALMLALLFIQLSIPIFNNLINKQLSLLLLPNVYFWLVGLALATGLLAGTYPALYLSSFKPAAILKGKLVNTISAVAIRKGLVIFQFAVSIVLILVATLISNQMSFLASQNLGFDKEQKVIIPIQTSEAATNAEALKNELSNSSQVISGTIASTYPGIENIQDALFYAEGKSVNETVDITSANIGEEYIETLGIELLHGRGFSKDFLNDTSAVVLNEAAILELGYPVDGALGKNIYYEFQGKKVTMHIIGVVKNYHYQSLQQKVKPLLLTKSPFFSAANNYLILSVKGTNAETIAAFEKTWNKINPGSPFMYSFLDEDFQKNYQKEARTLTIVKYFTAIAIIIACLGLFGLASFTAEQRVKEIGVRKVLGASITQIVALLSADFLKLVVISIVIASPIAFYLMREWLQGFAYHTDINLWVFVLVGMTAICIAFVTVSFQAIKAAILNPVNSLKSE